MTLKPKLSYFLLVFFAFGLAATPVQAQSFSSLFANKPVTAAASKPADPLGRDDPRDTIFNFLQACHDGNYTRAAQYLDLSKIPSRQQATEGPRVAKTLSALLDRDTHFEVERLDNSPDGRPDDELAPDIDRLDTFELNGRTVPLFLQRVTRSGTNIWLVSADSVPRIPSLASLAEPNPIEKHLPAALVDTKLLDTSLWVWIALALAVLLISALSKLLSRVAIAVARPIGKRYIKTVPKARLQALTEPLRLLVSLIVFRAAMELIGPSALFRDYLLKILGLLFVLGSGAIAMRFIDLLSDQIVARLDPRQRALSFSVMPLGVRFVKICIFCIAILVVLNQWGYNTTTILAGVGVGGLAVALAAQKTIENLFGGVSVISDRPVLVGDYCQFGGQSGTVEDIGLRSTRIRTLDRTVLTIPNSQFSTMTLENFSRRERMWFHPTLELRRDATPDQIRRMMDAVAAILKAQPKVDPTAVPVRFTKIGKESFSLEIFSYVLTSDGDEFVRIQTELLLKFLAAAHEIGVNFAVPFQLGANAGTVTTNTAELGLDGNAKRLTASN